MEVFLHTDPNTDGSRLMAEHLETVVKHALSRFGERITRVEAHLSDLNSQSKGGANDIQCLLEARVVDVNPVVVKEHADTAHQAIEGAVHKLRRAVEAAIEKHDPLLHRRAKSERPVDATADDQPG